mmetsp:Transcript_52682/g.111916  ORF Transcript_52682/g.111916 Transcript_52682/m.111916 type:complete len:227 (-) Transcript_52682:900-1580(-)
MNELIAAGPLTAARTSGKGVKRGVIIGRANHCTAASTTPSNDPQAKMRSATSRAASSPPAARAEGTSAAAVPWTPRWATTPRLYICIVIPYAAPEIPVGSSTCARLAAEMNATLSVAWRRSMARPPWISGRSDVTDGGLNSLDHLMSLRLMRRRRYIRDEASSEIDVAAAAPDAPSPFHNIFSNDEPGGPMPLLPNPNMQSGSSTRFSRLVANDTFSGVTVFSSPL